ncbi:MAG: hypothetical protein RJA10_4237 [Pseudomonadota bacterium]|jgi:hypothetical protein
MSLINALFRFLRIAQPAAAAGSGPVPLQANQLKLVGGGGGESPDSPRSTW